MASRGKFLEVPKGPVLPSPARPVSSRVAPPSPAFRNPIVVFYQLVVVIASTQITSPFRRLPRRAGLTLLPNPLAPLHPSSFPFRAAFPPAFSSEINHATSSAGTCSARTFRIHIARCAIVQTVDYQRNHHSLPPLVPLPRHSIPKSHRVPEESR